MWSKDEIKETNFKNCTFYYFNDIIKIADFDFLIVNQSYKNIFVYDISYET